MEVQDFEMPSPKRQRTNSPTENSSMPVPTVSDAEQITLEQAGMDAQLHEPASTAEQIVSTQQALNETPDSKGPDMLDFLMQHVESETTLKEAQPLNHEMQEEQTAIAEKQPAEASADDVPMSEGPIGILEAQIAPLTEASPASDTAPEAQEKSSDHNTTEGQHADTSPNLPPGLQATELPAIEHLQAVAEMNGMPPTSDTLVEEHIHSSTSDAAPAAHAEAAQEAREWETDSSAYGSSDSSDTSSDSSSDDDSDEGEGYTLLDPYEQARILMAEDGVGGGGGDSDDEGGPKPNKSSGGAGLRTLNEKPEDILPKPNIQVTDEMVIEELGTVEGVIENTALIKAKVSGEYQVFESGSVLCLGPPNRTVIGAVSETLGRVEQPLYTVRFASDTDVRETFGLSAEQDSVEVKGIKIFYVKQHSSFVFTQPLKAAKGTDASNIHDEEVGEDEMEFSDDEAEAEYKRQQKLRKKGIDPATQPPGGRGGRGGRGQRGVRGGFGSRGGGSYNMHSIPESDTASVYSNGNVEMNYDDVEEGETGMEYTPLRRPETMSNGMNEQRSPPSHVSPQSSSYQSNGRDGYNQTRSGRGRGGGDRGRGDRGRGRGRGSGQGNYQNNNYNQNSNNNYASNSMYNSNYSQQPAQQQYPPQQQQQYYPPQQQQQPYFFQPPPPPPQLTPYSSTGSNNIPPSPMTPLSGPGNFNFNYMAQNQAQQGQWAQYHTNQNSQYQAQQAQYGTANGVNAEALAQVQRQLEEMRRQAGQGQGQ